MTRPRLDGTRAARRAGAAGATLATAVATAVAACATPGVPPGGPPDVAPPVLLRVSPDTNSVGQRPRAVVLRFDEVISEQPRGGSGGGAAADGNLLAGIVTVSPRSGAVEVDWGRERLAIRPRRGFRPNTTYTITVGPGLADVRGNALDTAIVVTFATGPTLDRAQLRGVVFDWVGGKASPRAVVEAASATDTTLVFTAIAGEDGRFVIPNVPPGRYLVRGTLDVNTNRFADPREPFDTARGIAVVPPVLPAAPRDTGRVRADTGRAAARRDSAAARPAPPARDTLAVSLYAFARDTVRPRVTQVQAGADSVTLRLTFDRPLLPGQRLDTASVRILAADSTPVRVLAVRTPAQVDSLQKARAAADSAARADSLRARGGADSAQAAARPAGAPTGAAAGAANAGAARPEGAVPSGALGQQPPSRPRSALARPAARPGANGQPQRPQRPAPEPPPIDRPIPSAELVVTIAAPLRPQAAYRVQAVGVRSLNGVVGTSDRVYTTPRPERAARAEPPRPAPGAPAGQPPAAPRPASPSPAPSAAPAAPTGSRPPR